MFKACDTNQGGHYKNILEALLQSLSPSRLATVGLIPFKFFMT
jgi:hypothetical protein